MFEACKFEYEPFDVEGYGPKDEITERYAKPGDLTLVKFLMSLNQNRGSSKEAKAAQKIAQEKEEKLVKDLNALSLQVLPLIVTLTLPFPLPLTLT